MNDERPSISPRSLLEGSPGEYVTRRSAAVAAARAAGDKALASRLKALSRPGLALWAVLVAGRDEDAVREVVDATRALATVQAGGADRSTLAAATADRRRALARVVDEAVGALVTATTPAAQARRAEIASIAEQLARRPDLAASWVDGTLRELPESALGFDAFEGMEIVEPPRRDRLDARPDRLAPTPVTTTPPSTEPDPAELAARRRQRARDDAAAALDAARRRADEAATTAERARLDADRRREQWEAACHELDRAEDEAAQRREDVARLTEELERLNA